MALFIKLTRPALRIAIEALEAYMPKLSAEGQEIARSTVGQLRYQLESANRDNRRREEERSS